MSEYSIHAAQVGATALPGITGQTIQRQREKHQPVTAGGMFHRLRSIKRQVGLVNLTTSGLKAILDLMPQGTGATALPYPHAKIGSGTELTLWGVKGEDDLSRRATGTVHEKLLISKGLLALQRIAWREAGEPAVATVNAWPLSTDGETEYWTASADASPPALVDESDFTLYSAKVGTAGSLVAIPEPTDLELAFEAPAVPRFGFPGARRPTYIAGAPSEGYLAIACSLKTPDRSLFRTYGEGFAGSAERVLELIFKNYGQAAERGTATVTLTLKCTVECTQADDAHPGSVNLLAQALNTDLTGAVWPFTWATAAA